MCQVTFLYLLCLFIENYVLCNMQLESKTVQKKAKQCTYNHLFKSTMRGNNGRHILSYDCVSKLP